MHDDGANAPSDVAWAQPQPFRWRAALGVICLLSLTGDHPIALLLGSHQRLRRNGPISAAPLEVATIRRLQGLIGFLLAALTVWIALPIGSCNRHGFFGFRRAKSGLGVHRRASAPAPDDEGERQ